jgi:hypothetical protein
MRIMNLLGITFRVVVRRRGMSSFLAWLPCASFFKNAKWRGCDVLWCG